MMAETTLWESVKKLCSIHKMSFIPKKIYYLLLITEITLMVVSLFRPYISIYFIERYFSAKRFNTVPIVFHEAVNLQLNYYNLTVTESRATPRGAVIE